MEGEKRDPLSGISSGQVRRLVQRQKKKKPCSLYGPFSPWKTGSPIVSRTTVVTVPSSS